jgi:hypothetical protein
MREVTGKRDMFDAGADDVTLRHWYYMGTTAIDYSASENTFSDLHSIYT